MISYELELVICTFDPRMDFLERTLAALRSQDLPFGRWRLTIIDNASPQPLAGRVDLSWHPNGRVIREEQIGLTNARLRAFAECQSELIVWSDDDNVLAPDYLSEALKFMSENPTIGIAGGKSLPEYQSVPPSWYRPDLAPLGCRDLGDTKIVMSACPAPKIYPGASPIGAGMVSRHSALRPWIELVKSDSRRRALGRTGQALTSGEDNDMNLTALRNGWDLAYLPQLSLIHLMPPGRLTLDYQKRMARASFRDFVTVLDLHGIRPWPSISRWSVMPRAIKSWLTCRAWKGAANSIRWHGLLGQYEGRARLDLRRVDP
jgi:GT2 family glycosyltransferase